MIDGTNDRDGFALSLSNTEAYIGMRDQAVGFQYFRNFLLGLDFG